MNKWNDLDKKINKGGYGDCATVPLLAVLPLPVYRDRQPTSEAHP